MSHAQQVLEFGAIRSLLAARCETEVAAEQAGGLEPSFVGPEVVELLAETDEAYQCLANDSPPSLATCRDLRDALKRAEKNGSLGGLELIQIADAMFAMRNARRFLDPKKQSYARLWAHAEIFPDIQRLESKLFDTLDSSGDVRETASPKLASLRAKRRGTQSRLLERIQAHTNRNRELLSDPIYTVRDGRYVIPVKSEYRGRIKGIVHDTSASGQTVYIEPDDVLQLGNQIREIEAAEREECAAILRALSAQVGAHALEIAAGLRAASKLDLIFAKARLAFDQKAFKPEFLKTAGIEFEGARHPLLDENQVVPIDMSLGVSSRGLLITGPNTGGKTVAMKTVGLFVLMAQSGLFLPARMVRIGTFSQVWADIGDEQSLQQSLSTFSAHLRNISQAVKGLQKGALVLLDEIGAGTDPAEGAALAKAILRHLVDNGAVVLSSSHYGELKSFAFETEGFANAAMEFDAKSLKPTYRVLMGAVGSSHALKIAERHGVPKIIVDVAKEAIEGRDQDLGRAFEQLETAQKQARIAQGEADRKLAEAMRLEKTAQTKLSEADEIRRTVHAKANAEIEEVLREVRLQAHEVFENLKNSADQNEVQKARESLKQVQVKGQKRGERFKAPQIEKTDQTLAKGSEVRIQGHNQIGIVLSEPKDGKVQVQVGALKMSFAVHALTPTATKTKLASKSTSIQLGRAQSAATEIHLRAQRAEDAVEQLEKFLDEAMLAGLHQVRIVHGKGEGILRKATHDILRRYRGVKSFRDGEPGEGGAGVTVALFG
ncbi:MAG: endonuclease MutS2 [Fimbriimonadaceae bacterium]